MAHLLRPNCFVTFACNPNRPEVKPEVESRQSSSDRPDLTARVFNLKLNALMHDLVHKHVLGKVIGHIHVVKFLPNFGNCIPDYRRKLY